MNEHFNKTFWYVVYLTTFVFAYILLITFKTIPETNLRLADTSLGILLGVLGSAGAYLIGGTPTAKKNTPTPPDGGSVTTEQTSSTTIQAPPNED